MVKSSFKILLKLVSFLILFAVLSCKESMDPPLFNDFDQEVEQLNQALDSAKLKWEKEPREEWATSLVSKWVQKASLTGSFADYYRADSLIDFYSLTYPRSLALLFYRCSLNYKMHRFDRASKNLKRIQRDLSAPSLDRIKADLDLQAGKYQQAITAYHSILKREKTWDNIARKAYYYSITGEYSQAYGLYEQAKKMLTAKEMRHYAWIELQQGVLYLEQEKYGKALKHYQKANRAYSGYWLIEEHMAEVYFLLGREKESQALYLKILKNTPHPEFFGALANIYQKSQPRKADSLRVFVDSLYQWQINLFPETAYGHMIETYLNYPSHEQDSLLLVCSKKNVGIRPNAKAKFLLAQAYLKVGEPHKAVLLLMEIKRTPWRSVLFNRIAKGLNLSLKS